MSQNTRKTVSPEYTETDELTDVNLRPAFLRDFIGQPNVKEQVAIFIGAAKARGEALDHVLLSGPPGLGKTTLAHIFANELGVGLHLTSGPVLERTGDLASMLTNLDEKDVLFVDATTLYTIYTKKRSVDSPRIPCCSAQSLNFYTLKKV